jgi:hypothetical protein
MHKTRYFHLVFLDVIILLTKIERVKGKGKGVPRQAQVAQGVPVG